VWPLGAMGRAGPTRIAIFAPCHRCRRAGINSFRRRSIADCRLSFTSHFRLGFEPIVEIATIPFAAKFEELLGPFSNLPSNLLIRQFLFVALSLLLLFHLVVPTCPEGLAMGASLRITCALTVLLHTMSPRDLAARQAPVHRRNQSTLRH
jgi:hypothetical protein